MTRKLIDWLVAEDTLDLRVALGTGSADESPDGNLDPETQSTAEPALTISGIQKSRKKLVPLRLGLILLLIVTSGILLAMPDSALGPVAEAISPVRDPLRASLGLQPKTPETPQWTGEVIHPASGTAATGTTPGKSSTSVANAAITSGAQITGATTAQATSTATDSDNATEPDGSGSKPDDANNIDPQWVVIIGPLQKNAVPEPVKGSGYPSAISFAAESRTGREVISTQPVDNSALPALVAELESSSFRVRTEEKSGAQYLRVGPFQDTRMADAAALILVGRGVPPQTRDVTYKVRVPYVQVGPFDLELDAKAYALDASRQLTLKATYRKAAPP